MNSENKTPQEELLEEVKEQEAAVEAASHTQSENKEEKKPDNEKKDEKVSKEGKEPKKDGALKKLTSSRKFKRMKVIREDLALPEDCPVIPFSAEKGNGRDELVKYILAAVKK